MNRRGRWESERVVRWRYAVEGYPDHSQATGLTFAARVLLLRLADDMNPNAIVSVPRSKLAAELGVRPASITDWIADAQRLGFLDTVRRGRPGVTAVYQGLTPTAALGTRRRTNQLVPPSVPSERPSWYATTGSQERVTTAASGQSQPGDSRNDGTDGDEPQPGDSRGPRADGAA